MLAAQSLADETRQRSALPGSHPCARVELDMAFRPLEELRAHWRSSQAASRRLSRIQLRSETGNAFLACSCGNQHAGRRAGRGVSTTASPHGSRDRECARRTFYFSPPRQEDHHRRQALPYRAIAHGPAVKYLLRRRHRFWIGKTRAERDVRPARMMWEGRTIRWTRAASTSASSPAAAGAARHRRGRRRVVLLRHASGPASALRGIHDGVRELAQAHGMGLLPPPPSAR